TGERKGATSTLGPNLSRRVRAATAAIAIIGSRTGSGEESRSENQSESISVLSQVSIIRQKSSGPSGPAGQGPGMTPIRYLICIAGTLASAGPRPVHGEVNGLLGDEFEEHGHALLGLADRSLDGGDDLAGLRHPLAVAAERARHVGVVAADVGGAVLLRRDLHHLE